MATQRWTFHILPDRALVAESEGRSKSLRAGDTVCLVAVLGCLSLFVGQDVGSNTTRSVESDWLAVEKVI